MPLPPIPRFCRWLLVALSLSGAALNLTSCKDAEPAATPAPAVGIGLSPLPKLAAQDAVVYEIFIADFSQAGTLDGLIPRLDSIKNTGANVLWLMPVFPTRGSPYAVDDYAGINPEFGNLAAFDRVVRAAHAKGLRVLLDWMANHTSLHHAWLRQHPDWYVRTAGGQPAHPDPQWTDVAQLDHAQPALRQAMISQMQTWVAQHGVDGFRCDAADYVPDDFWREAIPRLRQTNPNLLLLAEGRRASHYASGFDLAFGWTFFEALNRVFAQGAPAGELAVAHAQEMQSVPAGAARLRFTTNHDEVQRGTPAARLGGPAAARAAFVATLAYGATPLLYNGQEVGDPAQLAAPTRTPIRWGHDPAEALFFRRLLRRYQALPAWRSGSVNTAAPHPAVVAVRHQLNGQEVVVLVNTRNAPAAGPWPTTWAGGPAWTDALTAQPVAPADSLRLPAYGYAVWQR